MLPGCGSLVPTLLRRFWDPYRTEKLLDTLGLYAAFLQASTTSGINRDLKEPGWEALSGIPEDLNYPPSHPSQSDGRS